MQGLLGSGHLRRALRIAEACAGRGFEVVVAHGGLPAPWPPPEGVELVQLPAIRSVGDDFRDLRDLDGRPVSEALWKERLRHLCSILRNGAPDLLVTELFPFGRRAFARELAAWLDAARSLSPPPGVFASVRDILVRRRNPARIGEAVEWANRWYDGVLVHGDPRLVPFEASFPAVKRLRVPLFHTGYVVGPPPPERPAARRGVVVSAGGGAVGARLLEVAVAARPRSSLAGEPWTLIVGYRGNLEALREQAAAAPDRLELIAHADDLPERLMRARISVSQAGYNTVAEALACRTPMVLVPFARNGEDEQTRRAGRLASLGIARCLAERDLGPERLARAVDELAEKTPESWPDLALDGALRTAERLADWRARGRSACR